MVQILTNDPRYPGSLDQARSIITNIGNLEVNPNDMGAAIREWIAADEANQERVNIPVGPGAGRCINPNKSMEDEK